MRKILTLLALSAALQAQAASLEIEITGMQGVEGQVLVALFDRAETWLTRPVQARKLTPGGDGTLRLRFDDLPEGQYAYSLLHDLNGNGRMDFNLIGMPTEAYAFSNNAGRFGAPKFEEASFTLAGDLRQRVSLR
jgi:uncharacterized protein (DUF2141 family)